MASRVRTSCNRMQESVRVSVSEFTCKYEDVCERVCVRELKLFCFSQTLHKPLVAVYRHAHHLLIRHQLGALRDRKRDGKPCADVLLLGMREGECACECETSEFACEYEDVCV